MIEMEQEDLKKSLQDPNISPNKKKKSLEKMNTSYMPDLDEDDEFAFDKKDNKADFS